LFFIHTSVISAKKDVHNGQSVLNTLYHTQQISFLGYVFAIRFNFRIMKARTHSRTLLIC